MKKKMRLNLSATILIGFLLGISCGLFFGEYCAPLKLIGIIFIKLLQMTILPYIVISLIVGIGRLTYGDAKVFAKRAGAVLLIIWGIGFVIILAMPIAFPVQETASFFSSYLIEDPERMNILDLYIPSNPFKSMANAVVPAVVLFCIAVGTALIGIKDKDNLIHNLSVLSAALTRVAHFVVKLTPIGVFALAASVSGTLSVEEFGRLQVYFLTFIVAALFMTFWVLPMLIATLTPFRYRDIIGVSKDALITGFATFNLFIILPILAENCKDLFERYTLNREDTDFNVDILVPVSYNFPNLGKLLMLLFILFGGWFTGAPLSFTDYPQFVFSGLFTFFAHSTLAIPFLLDSFQIPADLFQLFLATNIVTAPFDTLLGVMSLFAFTLISASAISGSFSVKWKSVFNYSVITAVLAITVIGGTRFLINTAITNDYTKDKVIAEMHLVQNQVQSVVHTTVPKLTSVPESGMSRLERIRNRGVLRAGYMRDFLPFSYFNHQGELVGHDIDMAHKLAGELGVTLEFIPVELDTMVRHLDEGRFDIVMSALAITPERLEKMGFSATYMDATLAFIVKDHRRKEFHTMEGIRKIKGLKIGVIGGKKYFAAKLHNAFPRAEVVTVESLRDFFEKKKDDLDALLFAAEPGAAWTLLYPEFQVVVPKPRIVSQPAAYPIARGDEEMENFMNRWIELKKKDGTMEKLYNYWILGKGATQKKPRWCIIRDVLHWVD